MDLSKLTTPKIEYLRSNLNLTDDEEVVFDMLTKKKSILEIASRLDTSSATVSRRIKQIRLKIENLEVENG